MFLTTMIDMDKYTDVPEKYCLQSDLKSGMSVCNRALVTIIEEVEPVELEALADALGCHRDTMSRKCEYLHNEGVVDLQQCPADARKKIVTLHTESEFKREKREAAET